MLYSSWLTAAAVQAIQVVGKGKQVRGFDLLRVDFVPQSALGSFSNLEGLLGTTISKKVTLTTSIHEPFHLPDSETRGKYRNLNATPIEDHDVQQRTVHRLNTQTRSFITLE